MRMVEEDKPLLSMVAECVEFHSRDNNYDGTTFLSSLLETMETSMTTRQNNNQWTRLQCRLSSPRRQCAAVVVHNRYIVILGGDTFMYQDLSSVDIMDTAPPHNNNNDNGEPTIVAGPRMNSTRSYFGAAVVDNRIFVVGGLVNSEPSTLVEPLLFLQQTQDKDHTNSNSNVIVHFPIPHGGWNPT